jgi:hypothetical protein
MARGMISKSKYPYYQIRLWNKENKDLLNFSTFEEALKEYGVLVRMFENCNVELTEIDRDKRKIIKRKMLLGNALDFITEEE